MLKSTLAMVECPKCGIYTRFARQYVNVPLGGRLQSGEEYKGERIIRRCEMCTFEFTERVCS